MICLYWRKCTARRRRYIVLSVRLIDDTMYTEKKSVKKKGGNKNSTYENFHIIAILILIDSVRSTYIRVCSGRGKAKQSGKKRTI